jgi:hypothetical protein
MPFRCSTNCQATRGRAALHCGGELLVSGVFPHLAGVLAEGTPPRSFPVQPDLPLTGPRGRG